MAIHVYKEGDTHVVNGVRCEIVECIDVRDMEAHLSHGCVHDEKDLYGGNKDEDSSGDEYSGQLSHGEAIRQAAKEAGYEDWDTAHWKTLKARLNAAAQG